MNIWWTSMTAFEHIYWAIALTFSLILGIQLIIACISGLEFNSGSDLDVHHGGDIGTHFQLLTIRNIVAFFAIFGWSGITLYHQHLSTVLVIILSFLCGLVMMFICAAIFYGLSKLQCSGTIENLKQAVGMVGRVYLVIPGSMKGGTGKIEVLLQGKKVELVAFTKDPDELKTGSIVKIKEIIDNQVLVERY